VIDLAKMAHIRERLTTYTYWTTERLRDELVSICDAIAPNGAEGKPLQSPTEQATPISFATVCRDTADNYERRAIHNAEVAAKPRKANSLAVVASMERSHEDLIALVACQRSHVDALRILARICERAEALGAQMRDGLDVLSSGEHASFDEYTDILESLAAGYTPAAISPPQENG
jgi:hypothetical protein